MSQNVPGDARKLVGERDRQHVVVQPLFGCLDPGLEPMALPDCAFRGIVSTDFTAS